MHALLLLPLAAACRGLGKSFKQGRILCTPITAALVRLKLRVPAEALVPLPLGQEVTVEGEHAPALQRAAAAAAAGTHPEPASDGNDAH